VKKLAERIWWLSWSELGQLAPVLGWNIAPLEGAEARRMPAIPSSMRTRSGLFDSIGSNLDARPQLRRPWINSLDVFYQEFI
jgi:hypothetical protein